MDAITAIKFLAGFVLLIGGAELLVRGSCSLAVAAGISPLVVGLTVVAYGTSAPELAVTLQSVLAETPQPDLAIGNVVGSNTSNILLVLGISAITAPLIVSRELLRISVPLMVGLACLVAILGGDGLISRLEGTVLVLLAISYTAFAVISSRKATAAAKSEDDDLPSPENINLLLQCFLMLVGLGLLLLGATWLVTGAVSVAKTLGVSELVIGLTVIAIGTSLPEIATSIVAGMRGQRDIAVGNVVGSNMFNVMMVLGVTALVSPVGVAVSAPARNFDIPIMIGASIACLPVFFTGYQISRWEGGLFLAYYIAYTIFLFLKASEHALLQPYSRFMIGFMIPLTCIGLVVLSLGYFRKSRRAKISG